MNRLTVAIQLNDRYIIVGTQWLTMRSRIASARLKLAQLKHKAHEVAVNVAMILIPLPSVVAA